MDGDEEACIEGVFGVDPCPAFKVGGVIGRNAARIPGGRF